LYEFWVGGCRKCIFHSIFIHEDFRGRPALFAVAAGGELRLLRERLEGLEKSISGTSVKLPAQFGTPPTEKIEK
jgi:hypothetical protein